jgi:hypothetical protein
MLSAFDFVLVVLGVHEDVHRVGEVGVGAFLALGHDLFELVVGLVDRLGSGAGEQVLELELDDRGAAAALAVFGLLHDERIVADHHDIAGAEFLGGFHGECFLQRKFGTRYFSRSRQKCTSPAARSRRCGEVLRPLPIGAASAGRASENRRPVHAPGAVPGQPERPQVPRRRGGGEEGVQLDPVVRILGLRIDLPDEGLCAAHWARTKESSPRTKLRSQAHSNSS